MISDERVPFGVTTEDTGNIGQSGHDKEPTWTRFDMKYRPACVSHVVSEYPWCKEDAEDIVQNVWASIDGKADIAVRRFGEKFRNVLKRLIRWEVQRMHPKSRYEAEKTLQDQPRSFLLDRLFPNRVRLSEERRRKAELAEVVVEELLDPGYENGRCNRRLDEEKLGLWRRVMLSESKRPGTVARELGLGKWRVTRAFNDINVFVREEVEKLAEDLHYLRDLGKGGKPRA